jgi:hypothetical protein
MTTDVRTSLAILALAAALPGCTDLDYPFTGIAYKTYAAPAGEVHRSARNALSHMAIVVRSDQKTPTGWEIEAAAADRNISVEVEQLTANTTRLRVAANRDTVLTDRATAAEIVAQTSDALDARLAAKSTHRIKATRQPVASNH